MPNNAAFVILEQSKILIKEKAVKNLKNDGKSPKII